jgi:hypothetical protein
MLFYKFSISVKIKKKKKLSKMSKNCQKVVKSCQKVVKKLSKSCQSCQKNVFIKKLSKSCQKVVKKFLKKGKIYNFEVEDETCGRRRIRTRTEKFGDQLRRSQGEARASLTKLKEFPYLLQMSEKCSTNPTVTQV